MYRGSAFSSLTISEENSVYDMLARKKRGKDMILLGIIESGNTTYSICMKPNSQDMVLSSEEFLDSKYYIKSGVP